MSSFEKLQWRGRGHSAIITPGDLFHCLHQNLPVNERADLVERLLSGLDPSPRAIYRSRGALRVIAIAF